jgi:hypothetical protein
MSDNPSGADDQQERLITPDWVVGFVDGEGCFSISLVRQADRVTRKGYKTGWQVTPRFAVTQGERSRAVLEALQRFFCVGRIYRNRRWDNHKEDLFRYDVSRLEDLAMVIIPFFTTYQLKTAKHHDFVQFRKCVDVIVRGDHVRKDGLITILELMQTMNHRKSREDVIGILRGHTPNIPTAG